MASPSARAQRHFSTLFSVLLVVLIAVLVNYVASRHFRRTDLTGAKIYSLSEKTQNIARALARDVKVTLFMIPGNEVYPFTDELLQQIERYAPAGRLTIASMDIDKQRDEAALLAKKYNISSEDFRDGVVVFESGDKTKYVTKNEMVEYDEAEGPMGGGPPKLRSFRGEAAFASALLTVTEGEQTEVCFIKGHGESDPESFEEAGYSVFAEELRRDNNSTKTVRDMTSVLPACRVLVIGGPQRQWESTEVAALDLYLGQGGKVLLFLGPVLDRSLRRFAKTGLEDMLGKWGVHIGDNIVVDPVGAHPLEGPAVWATDSYGPHAITRGLAGKVTFWPQARQVQALGGGGPGRQAHELVRTSADGWGESSLAVFRREEPLRFDAATDTKGPVSVAVAVDGLGKGGRLVVVGTPMLVENYRVKGDVLRDYNLDFALSAVAWLSSRAPLVAVGAKQPEHIKLTLTDAQLRGAALLTILGLPLCGCLVGLGVWWRRRS